MEKVMNLNIPVQGEEQLFNSTLVLGCSGYSASWRSVLIDQRYDWTP